VTAPASLKFRVQDIVEAGGLDVTLELDSKAFFTDPPSEAAPVGTLKVSLEFSLGTEEVLLQASLAGAWELACGRCLLPHTIPFKASLEETYPSSAEDLDAGEAVRESALLEIPQRSLCRPDCRGFCPHCGKNLNETSCACPPADESQAKPSPFGVLKKLKEL